MSTDDEVQRRQRVQAALARQFGLNRMSNYEIDAIIAAATEPLTEAWDRFEIRIKRAEERHVRALSLWLQCHQFEIESLHYRRVAPGAQHNILTVTVLRPVDDRSKAPYLHLRSYLTTLMADGCGATAKLTRKGTVER